MNVLLVEDDPPLAASLLQALRGQGFTLNHVANGKTCLEAIAVTPPDMIILDLGLPDMDGLDVLKRVRTHNADIPVLLLTARGTAADKVIGLDSGADDYLAKPFDLPELVARLRVVERRLSNVKSPGIQVGPVLLDTLNQTVIVNHQEIKLSRREYMLLKLLFENAGRVLTRSSLEDRLYSWGEEVASNAIEVHVHHLRKKLGQDLITTVHGIGYKVSSA